MSHVIDFIEEAMDEEADYPEPQPMEMQPPPEEFPSDDSGSVGG
jgi:hypothetical protein